MRYGTRSDWAFGAHSQAAEFVGKGKRVLDVGCSTGELARLLVQNGCTVVGIEYDPEAAAKAREVCESVVVGDIEVLKDLPFRPKEFDHILFMDVLEHLRDPGLVLSRLRPFLKNDGTVICSIPNVANLSVRIRLLTGHWDYDEYGILDKTHLRFFTRRTAVALVNGAGLKVESVGVTPGAPLVSRVYRRPVLRLNYSLSRVFPTFLAMQFLITARPAIAMKAEGGDPEPT